MRDDAIGIFWQDVPTGKGRDRIARVMPDIPDTGWLPLQADRWPNLRNANVIAIDTETKDPDLLTRGPGWARNAGHVVGVSLATEDGCAWYLPIRHEVEPEHNLPVEHVLAYLRDQLGNAAQPKVGANLMYDVGWLRHEGVPVDGMLLDVQFAESLLTERGDVGLDALGQQYLGRGKETSLLYQWCSDYYSGAATGAQRANIYRAPPRLVGPYAEDDARMPLQILVQQYARLASENLVDLFHFECALIPMLIEMRYRGVRVDLNRAEQLSEELAKKVVIKSKELSDLAGFEVNVNASDSLARLFDKLGLPYNRTKPTEKKPDGSPSFTKDFLDDVEHPVGDVIREIRNYEKLRGTFIQSYILDSHVNGRVHCQFHPLRGTENGARSGRFSSSDPNLQNIPSRDKVLAPLVRGLFLPDEGYPLWRRYDYSQIEYRGLVHFAVGKGSDEARNKYITDPSMDYHEYVAKMIEALTGIKLPRSLTKNVNFGLVYGMGIAKLIRYLGLDRAKGKELFGAYHEGVPFVKETMEATTREVEQLGYITTILGRRSRFDLWEPMSYGGDRENRNALPLREAVVAYGQIQRAYMHKALNRRLQGSAADLMKKAMLVAWQQGLYKETGVPHVTVHDELGFSDDGSPRMDKLFAEVAHIMENAIPLRVPVLAECERGPDWGHLAKYNWRA